tara:strand:+ start:397 stop:1422 length:1026 start_codon:yes stop_codon:yes gene_type:complete
MKNIKKKALITGITGQDGSYLAKLLLEKNYEVFGTSRKSNKDVYWRLNRLNIKNDLKIYNSSIINTSKLSHFLKKESFSEIYNLSGISSVKQSFLQPVATFKANTLDCLRILDSINKLKLKSRFYQASSSEMFGNKKNKCNEKSQFSPLSPYAISKLSAHQIAISYRNNYNIFASTGILFNHESPLRNDNFVSKKIINGLISIKMGIKSKIKVGNMYVRRDWGHAKDFVKAMHLILKHDTPDDFVISSENNYSVKDLINITCDILNINGKWKGRGLNEHFEFKNNSIISIDKKLFRPLDISNVSGNSHKARKMLNWKDLYSFRDTISEMIKHERKVLNKVL